MPIYKEVGSSKKVGTSKKIEYNEKVKFSYILDSLHVYNIAKVCFALILMICTYS